MSSAEDSKKDMTVLSIIVSITIAKIVAPDKLEHKIVMVPSV